MKKRMAAILTGMLLTVSLTACGSQDNGSSAPAAEQEEPDAAQVDTAEQSGESDEVQEAESQPEQQVEEGTDTADAGASAVYFTSDISPDGLMAAYKALNWEPTGLRQAITLIRSS